MRREMVSAPQSKHGDFISRNEKFTKLVTEDPKHKEDVMTVSILKACARNKDLHKGSNLHSEILQKGLLERNVYVGSSLINMYARCGSLEKARQVLHEMPVRDAVSWSALIAGYAQHGQGEQALDCLERMQNEGVFPDAVTFVSILKACSSTKAVNKGKRIHNEVVNLGMYGKDTVLGTALVDMYAKCGEIETAKQLFMELPSLNVVSWNVLIAGYVQQGQVDDALETFRQMQNDGYSPNAVTFICILKACGSRRDAVKGRLIHEEIVSKGLLKNHVALGNALVDMYAKCGMLAKAQQILDELPIRNLISWNGLITGYVQHGQGQDALNCFERMQKDGLVPDVITFSCVLKACGIIKAVDKGKEIHDMIISKALLEKDVVLGNALVDMYAKCGELSKASEILGELPVRDVISWSTLIAGYAEQGKCTDAWNCLEHMLSDGHFPNTVTLTCILKACSSTGALDKGRRIHHEISSKELFGKHLVLDNALVDMYAKCGELRKAREIFDDLPIRDVVSWNALITGYVREGRAKDALDCFCRMQQENISPDVITYISILKACGSAGEITVGQITVGTKIHHEIKCRSLLSNDVVLGTALVDMYAKCGDLIKAQKVFDGLSVRNIVLWNALISGYAQQGQGERALDSFEAMQLDNLFPDAITFISVLKACGNNGAIEKGKQIHGEVATMELLKNNVDIGNALIDMYAKCGELQRAQEVFDDLIARDVVSWNALISGYGQQGEADKALFYFEKMRHAGVSPDAVTLLCVLSACSHSGMVDKGRMYFTSMSAKYGIIPNVQHQTCMVDLLSRVGLFDSAMAIIQKMPLLDYPLWCSVLDACERWGNLKLGKLAFKRAIQLDHKKHASYFSMASRNADASLLQQDARYD